MILYINTKEIKTVTVALKKNGQMVAELSDHNEYGSQALLPLIFKILENNSMEFNELAEIEVEEGPGSFTGLRVGASVAQALGFALNIPVNGKVSIPLGIKYT